MEISVEDHSSAGNTDWTSAKLFLAQRLAHLLSLESSYRLRPSCLLNTLFVLLELAFLLDTCWLDTLVKKVLLHGSCWRYSHLTMRILPTEVVLHWWLLLCLLLLLRFSCGFDIPLVLTTSLLRVRLLGCFLLALGTNELITLNVMNLGLKREVTFSFTYNVKTNALKMIPLITLVTADHLGILISSSTDAIQLDFSLVISIMSNLGILILWNMADSYWSLADNFLSWLFSNCGSSSSSSTFAFLWASLLCLSWLTHWYLA